MKIIYLFGIVRREFILLMLLASQMVTSEVNITSSNMEEEKVPLYIGGMFSMTGGWDGSGCLMAAELALEQINNRTDILPDYELKMVWGDTQCDPGKGSRLLFDHIFSDTRKLILVGPACSRSAHPVAAAAPYWNFITVLYSATSASLSNREKYPYVYRNVPNGVNLYNGPYLWFIKNYGWRRLAVIYDPNDAFTARLEDINKRTVDINTNIISEVIDGEAKNLIDNLKDQDIRIIIVDAFEDEARHIFCEAYKAGFYGPDMFWALPGWYNSRWWWTDSEDVDCTPEQVAEAVEISLPIGVDVSPLSLLNNVTIAGITPQEFEQEMKSRLTWPKYRNITENAYMSYSFDAIWAVGLMLNNTANALSLQNTSTKLEDFSYTDPVLSQLFLEEFAKVKFFGASGDLAFEEGERLGYSKISQIQGQCDIDWHLDKRHCYRFVTEKDRNWYHGLTSCRSDGAVLVDIQSEKDIEVLARLYDTSGFSESTHYWNIGLEVVTSYDGTSALRDTNNNTVILKYLETRQSSAGTRGCIYIDFKDNETLKSGNCEETRPYICRKKAEFDYVTVATYDSVSDDMIWTNGIVWPGGDVTKDGITEFVISEVESMIPAYIYIITSSVSFLLIIMALMTILFVFWFSDQSIIIRANPCVCYLTLIGIVAMASSVFFNKPELFPDLDDNQHMILCHAQSTSASLGFILTISTLVCKIWKFYKDKAYAQSKVVSNLQLCTAILASFGVDVGLQLLIKLLYPLNVTTKQISEEVDVTDPNHVTVYYVRICTTGDQLIPLIITVVDKAVLLLLGLFWTIEIRQASFKAHEEEQLIAIGIYNVLIFASCGLILSLLLQNATPTEWYVISSTLIICCAIFTWIIIFTPKVLYILKSRNKDTEDREKPNFDTALTDLSSNASLERYVGKVPEELLDEHIRLKEQLTKLQNMVQEQIRGVRGAEKEQEQESITVLET
ncbi:gamma-aminobutyric acid type B receptor subunit 1-like isoform X2 [Apostichopus japonicus]|uniref:gamma-aminobutyric acid type B receptor subunit 1-like isoform X2 n=1 Tax=Stichopus japonicus TaxID=307972 RepID=UPI003AB7F607